MSAGSPSDATAPARWQAKLSNSTALAVGIYVLVALAATVAAYLAAFTVWQPYDDEGTLLVTLQSFADGGALYRDVYSPYGPFYHEVFGTLFALWGHPVTTNVSRSLVVVFWVGTSFLFGLAAQRLTGRLMLGVTGMIAAFATLYVLANEPMHPQVLCVLLFAIFVLLAVYGPGRRPLWLGAAAGAVLAALFLTKVNLGIFALAATALAAVLTVEPLRDRRLLRWPVVAAAIALPVFVAAQDLKLGWVRDLVVVEVLALAALAVAAWRQSPVPEGDEGRTARWLLGAVAGFAVAFVAIMAAIVLNGSSLPDVYDGMVAEAMKTREINISQFPMSPGVVDWAIVAFAGAVLCACLRRDESSAPSVWPGLLRAAAGLAIWFTVARITPLSLGPSAGNPDSLPVVLAWIAVIPPADVVESQYKRFLRVLLPALAVAEALQVYPVPGSQMGIASLLFVPVGALCLADALVSLRSWADAEGKRAGERLGVVLAVVLVALAADFAINSILRPIGSNLSLYRERQALPFPGATMLHLSPTDHETYTRLVADLHRYRCTGFVSYPNVNSLYLWSGIEPPPPDPPGIWAEAFDAEHQQRVVEELQATSRPCAIRNQGVAELWSPGHPVPERPLVNYVLGRFRPVDKAGPYEFMLPIERLAQRRVPG